MTRVGLSLLRRWILPRKKTAHKGDSGRVLIIAGSRGMVGAGVLASLGAVRAGAGLVRLLTVQSQQQVAAKRAPLEVTTMGLSEGKDGHFSSKAITQISVVIKNFKPDVVVFGPGVGVTAANARLLALLIRCGIPLVLDADGLNVLAGFKMKFSNPFLGVLTPHEAEAARLLGKKNQDVRRNRVASAMVLAKKFGCVVLLKGAGTVVTDGRTNWLNTTGNAGMASGGMGDVLSGVVGAVWGAFPRRDQEAGLRAAVAAAYIHGLAADLKARSASGRGMLASDVAETLPKAFGKIFGKKFN